MNVTRLKKGTSKFTPYSVTSDGTNYYVQAHLQVLRDKGKRMQVVAEVNRNAEASSNEPNRHLSQGREHLVFADDVLWACGNSIQTSQDRGESWTVVDIDGYKGGYFRHMEVAPNGIYACGVLEDKGLLAHRPNGGDFTVLPIAPSEGISSVTHCSRGLLLGGDEGSVWLADEDSVERIFKIERENSVADSDRPICWGAYETRSETVVLVGAEGVFRWVKGCETFEQTSDEVFSTLQELPSGELVAAGMNIMASSDDGLGWEELFEFENVGYSEKKKSCTHDDGVLIASAADGLFKVSI